METEIQNIFGSDQTWKIINQILILITIGSLVLAGYQWMKRKQEQMAKFFSFNRFPKVGGVIPVSTEWEAVIFTVSRPDVPEWVIQNLHPECVGLIASQDSLEVASKLSGFAKEQGSKFVMLADPISNPDDPLDSREACRELLTKMKAQGFQKLGVDVTGGKVPMSLGAFMAAEEAGVKSLYVASQFDPKLKKPNMSTATIYCISEPEKNHQDTR